MANEKWIEDLGKSLNEALAQAREMRALLLYGSKSSPDPKKSKTELRELLVRSGHNIDLDKLASAKTDGELFKVMAESVLYDQKKGQN